MKDDKQKPKLKTNDVKDIHWEHFPMEQEELNPLLGNFVVQFERVMRNIRETIATVLKKEGLNDDFYVEVLVHDSTAYNLRNYYVAILMKYFKGKEVQFPESKKYLELIYKKIQQAFTLRNMLLHSPWDTIYADEDDTLFLAEQYKVDKDKGLEYLFKTTPSKKSFNKVNVHMKSLANILLNVETAINDSKQSLISKEDLEKIKTLDFSFKDSKTKVAVSKFTDDRDKK